MIKNLPVYQFVIDESAESGVKCIALVDDPAINSFFVAFENEIPKPKYIKLKSHEQVVFGIALQPDLPIYRVDEVFGPYYGIFTKETIKQIVHKFHKEQQTQNVNLGHNERATVKAYMYSDYMVDSELQIQDLKAKGIPDAKIGSWVVFYKIEDKNVFEKVLNGEVGAFSVEAVLERITLAQINDKFSKMKKDKKSLLEKIVNIFTSEEEFKANRASVPELGFDIEWGNPGEPVNQVTVGPDGSETLSPVGPGEFITDAGTVVVDDSSNLLEVREAPAEKPAEAPAEAPANAPEDVPATGSTENQSTYEMKAYPWDQCIADQKDKGYSDESANKLCGYIKSKNMKSEELTNEMIAEVLGEENCLSCKEDKKKKMEEELSAVKVTLSNETEKFSKLFIQFEEIQKENEALKVENAELKDKLKEPIGEPILGAPVVKKEWSKMNAYERALERTRENQ